ncbi:MAG: hypothetical protein JEY99_11825 [Spirochaetales bacterium]|nr:hypothetical protein [Spirochaetales bacterium]
MKEWIRLMEHGKKELSKHQPMKALTEFQEALELCPVENKSELSKILFYLGISFHKLGFGGVALRTWSSGVRLHKFGPCSRMVDRMTNEYGMIKSEDDDENADYRAFHAIHLSRYLLTRGSKKFGSPAESDMVNDVIRGAWDVLTQAISLNDVSVSVKLTIFKKEVVVFPYLECPECWTSNEISYDFRNNFRLSEESSCNCGSGKPVLSCCGRIPSEDELGSGLF